MNTYHVEDLRTYLQTDWIADLLNRECEESEKNIRTNQWLFTMDNKRMIYADMYGDLLKGKIKRKFILDVGGGTLH